MMEEQERQSGGERFFDDSLISRLDALSMNFGSAVNNLYSGGRRSKMLGSTVEFANFREYIQGDDFRRIDWNAYGRFEKFFIKLFLDEKQLQTNIFVDLSASMDFGEPKKYYTAMRIAAAVAYISASATDRVNVTGLADGRSEDIAEGIGGKDAFFASLGRLAGAKPGGKTDLAASLRKCRALRGSSGASVLISDLMSDADFREPLKYLLYMKQQTVLVHLLSPEENDPPIDGMGRLRLIDSENGTYADIDAGPEALKLYAKALEDYTASVRDFCLKAGIYYIPARSDSDIIGLFTGAGAKAGVFS